MYSTNTTTTNLLIKIPVEHGLVYLRCRRHRSLYRVVYSHNNKTRINSWTRDGLSQLSSSHISVWSYLQPKRQDSYKQVNTRWFISAVVVTDLCIELSSAATTRLVQTGEHEMVYLRCRHHRSLYRVAFSHNNKTRTNRWTWPSVCVESSREEPCTENCSWTNCTRPTKCEKTKHNLFIV